MNNQLTNRFFISLVLLIMLWLYLSGIYIQIGLEDLRSSAVSNCMNGYTRFEDCYRKSQEIETSLFQFFIPFLPATLLLWIKWLLNIDIYIDRYSYPEATMKALRILGYIVGALTIVLLSYIYSEDQNSNITSRIFVIPWIAASWISAPLLFQKLIGPSIYDDDFTILYYVLYAVAAFPFLGLIILFTIEIIKH